MADEPMKAHGSAGPAQERAGLDWGHLRFFLALARTGSLSRAAKALGVDRNTVARRVAALEEELHMQLYERGPQGWIRTSAGEELAALASRVEDDVLALARHADAHDTAVAGTVRLTTAAHVAARLLAPAVPELRRRRPGLVLEIAVDQRPFDLTRREADLAVRVGRPRESGLVTRKLADVAFRLYASPAYLGRRRTVDLENDLFMGFDESLASAPQERWLGRVAPDRRVVFRCNSTAALIGAAGAGVGVAVLPCYAADCDPALVRLEGPEPAPNELWLLVHGDLRRTPRVRAVIEWLDGVIAAARPTLAGGLADGGAISRRPATIR
jgi:DNA-binding transcriptional LysR family regulator